MPSHELDTFLLTVNEAVELAEEGKAADGYTTLLAGLSRAREAVEDGQPWGRSWLGRGRRRWRTTRRGTGSGGVKETGASLPKGLVEKRTVRAASRSPP